MSFWCHRLDQKSNKNIVKISTLKFFVASWGLPGSFLGLPGDLVSNIINKEAYRKPPKTSKKPQGSYKNVQGWNPYNIFVAILVQMMTKKRHFEIKWPSVLALYEVKFTISACSKPKPLLNRCADFKSHCAWQLPIYLPIDNELSWWRTYRCA